MELKWDGARGRSNNAPGVETRVPGWGSTEHMEYIDPSWTAWLLGNVGSYISHLVKGRAGDASEAYKFTAIIPCIDNFT